MKKITWVIDLNMKAGIMKLLKENIIFTAMNGQRFLEHKKYESKNLKTLVHKNSKIFAFKKTPVKRLHSDGEKILEKPTTGKILTT